MNGQMASRKARVSVCGVYIVCPVYMGITSSHGGD